MRRWSRRRGDRSPHASRAWAKEEMDRCNDVGGICVGEAGLLVAWAHNEGAADVLGQVLSRGAMDSHADLRNGPSLVIRRLRVSP
jgi:hypothetical protein